MPCMPSRVATFLLAFVLAWSGFGASEGVNALISAGLVDDHAVAAAAPLADRAAGSVEHHHLDDQPAQSQHDLPHDTSALPSRAPVSTAPRAIARQPSHAAAPFARGPCLEGLLRPPRAASGRAPFVA